MQPPSEPTSIPLNTVLDDSRPSTSHPPTLSVAHAFRVQPRCESWNHGLMTKGLQRVIGGVEIYLRGLCAGIRVEGD